MSLGPTLSGSKWDTSPFGTAEFANAQVSIYTPAAARAPERFQDAQVVRERNFGDIFDVSSTADCTTALQNFLLECQMFALQIKGIGLDNLFQNDCVTAFLPRGIYHVSCPIVVPEYVNLKCEGIIERTPNWGSGGTLAYTGDTTTQALNNVYQPVLVVTCRGAVEAVNFYCNPDGNTAHQGNGMVVGKMWTAASATLVSSGAGGYSVNDVITLNQPSKAPLAGARITINSVDGSGNILTYTLTYGGAYGLPYVQQNSQWTTTLGFKDITAGGNIFTSNGSGVFNSTGGTGSGATFTIAWTPDYAAANATYNCGPGNIIGDWKIGRVRYQGVPVIANGNAACCGVMFQNLNHTVDDISGVGAFYGIYLLNGADFRANILNPVNAGTPISIFSWGSAECPNCVLDTPLQNVMTINQASNIRLSGTSFNGFPSSLPNVPNPGGISIGVSSSGFKNKGIYIDFDLTSVGIFSSAAYSPAATIANTVSSTINIRVHNNNGSGASVACKISQIAAIGSGVGNNVNIYGSIDLVAGTYSGGNPVSGPLFITTASTNTNLIPVAPPGDSRVWDGFANGVVGPGGLLTAQGAGAPTNGTSGTLVGKAPPESTYTDTSVSPWQAYKNSNTLASPTWTTTPSQTKSIQVPTTGFTISMTTDKLLLNPAGTLASGTINLPTTPSDGQICTVCSSQQVTALTLNATGGASIVAAPTFLAPGTPAAMEYDAGTTTWYPT